MNEKPLKITPIEKEDNHTCTSDQNSALKSVEKYGYNPRRLSHSGTYE